MQPSYDCLSCRALMSVGLTIDVVDGSSSARSSSMITWSIANPCQMLPQCCLSSSFWMSEALSSALVTVLGRTAAAVTKPQQGHSAFFGLSENGRLGQNRGYIPSRTKSARFMLAHTCATKPFGPEIMIQFLRRNDTHLLGRSIDRVQAHPSPPSLVLSQLHKR
jgi:hypothetical protein